MHYAAESNNAPAVAFLAQQLGANVNSRNTVCDMHISTCRRQLSLPVRVFLAASAVFLVSLCHGAAACLFVCQYAETPLHCAARGSREACSALIAARADVNAVAAVVDGALQWVCARRSIHATA